MGDPFIGGKRGQHPRDALATREFERVETAAHAAIVGEGSMSETGSNDDRSDTPHTARGSHPFHRGGRTEGIAARRHAGEPRRTDDTRAAERAIEVERTQEAIRRETHGAETVKETLPSKSAHAQYADHVGAG